MNKEVEDFGLGVKSWLVVTVSHHVQNISENAHVVFGVEQVGDLLVFVNIVENVFQQVQTQITVSA